MRSIYHLEVKERNEILKLVILNDDECVCMYI